LFPADAQELSWRTWHELSWTVPGPDGEPTRVTAADLLRRTVLYKVSHHGSAPGNPAAAGPDPLGSPDLTPLLPAPAHMAHALPPPPPPSRVPARAAPRGSCPTLRSWGGSAS